LKRKKKSDGSKSSKDEIGKGRQTIKGRLIAK
jgi:hypothetical protein